MRLMALAAAYLALSAAGAAPSAEPDQPLGSPMRLEGVEWLDGKGPDLAGRSLILMYWEPEAPGTEKLFESMHDCLRKWGTTGMVVAGLFTGDRAKAEAYLKAHPAKFPVGRDPGGGLRERLKIPGPNSGCAFRRDGRIERRMGGTAGLWAGAIDRVMDISHRKVDVPKDGHSEGVVKEAPPLAPAERGELLAEQTFQTPDLTAWKPEGGGKLSVADGRLLMHSTNTREPSYWVWYARDLPADFWMEVEYTLVTNADFAIMLFAARGPEGQDIFDAAVPERDGTWWQYTRGYIQCYHLSWRRSGGSGGLNLRKNSGKALLYRNPWAGACKQLGKPYHLTLVKRGPRMRFYIDGKCYLDFTDDGAEAGKAYGAGKFCFMMFPDNRATIDNFRVYALRKPAAEKTGETAAKPTG